MTTIDTPDWRESANCATTDPDLFFPPKGGSDNPAKRICANCTVTAECLAYALVHEPDFGWYGGMSVRDRRRLRRAVA